MKTTAILSTLLFSTPGVFAWLVVALVALAIVAFPGSPSVAKLDFSVPILLFELSSGSWLLAKGKRSPVIES